MLHAAGRQLVAVLDRRCQQAVAEVRHKEGERGRAAHQGQGGGLVGVRVQQGHHRLDQGGRPGQGRHRLIGRRFDQAQQAVPQHAVRDGQRPGQQQQVGPHERRRGDSGAQAGHGGQDALVDQPRPQQGRRQNAAEGAPQVEGGHRLAQGLGGFLRGLGGVGCGSFFRGAGGLRFRSRGGGGGRLLRRHGLLFRQAFRFGGGLCTGLFAPPARRRMGRGGMALRRLGRVLRGGRRGRGFRRWLLLVQFNAHGVVQAGGRRLAAGRFVLPHPEEVEPAHLLGDLLVFFRFGRGLDRLGAHGLQHHFELFQLFVLRIGPPRLLFVGLVPVGGGLCAGRLGRSRRTCGV